ncbi:MAG: class I SAM-dependent methyltransferase [Actinomycetota bacterium]|nr:class I SAM-dependent methyltransferase [Actinomycetota bacterium]
MKVPAPGRADPALGTRQDVGVSEDHFGEEVAAVYDADHEDMFAPEVVGPAVELLAGLAGGGEALELAIGTGRLAIPLAARGIPVSGIDLSAAMVERLVAKPGGERIAVTLGDMTTTRAPGRFALVYLVFNTIGNLTGQDEQVACFANAAAHLEPGGRFVVEVGVPDLRRLPPGEDARVFAHAPGYVGYDRYVDLVGQLAVSHHFVAGSAGLRESATPFRYVWPSELDLMARLAGLDLEDRWSDWQRSPFGAESRSHVSVWVKPGSPAQK